MGWVVNIGKPDDKGLVSGSRRWMVWPERVAAAAMAEISFVLITTRPSSFDPASILDALAPSDEAIGDKAATLRLMARKAHRQGHQLGFSARYAQKIQECDRTPEAFHGEAVIKEALLYEIRGAPGSRWLTTERRGDEPAVVRSEDPVARQARRAAVQTVLNDRGEIGLPGWIGRTLEQLDLDEEAHHDVAVALIETIAPGAWLDAAYGPFLRSLLGLVMTERLGEDHPSVARFVENVAALMPPATPPDSVRIEQLTARYLAILNDLNSGHPRSESPLRDGDPASSLMVAAGALDAIQISHDWRRSAAIGSVVDGAIAAAGSSLSSSTRRRRQADVVRQLLCSAIQGTAPAFDASGGRTAGLSGGTNEIAGRGAGGR